MDEKYIGCGIPGRYIYSRRTNMSGDFAAHVHHYYEFLLISRGMPHCIVEGNNYELSPGDMLITSPNELHSISFTEPQIYTRRFFQISKSYLEDVSADIFDVLNSRKIGTKNVIPSSLCQSYKIYNIFYEMDQYTEILNKYSNNMVLANALRLVSKVSSVLETESVNVSSKLSSTVTDIEKFISSHLTEPINLDFICDHMFLDKSYMCRLFKSETGITLKAYINMQRITLAKNMLLNSMSATKIYLSCGFNDYSTFYRAFIKYAGMTPEQFINYEKKKL